MWRNIKALEEENQRLRKEVREWVNKALELSKRLHASDPMAVNSTARLKERLRAAARQARWTAPERRRQCNAEARAMRAREEYEKLLARDECAAVPWPHVLMSDAAPFPMGR